MSRDLPYPYPTSEAITAIMKGNRRSDTRPEVLLRSALHRLGFRFRKDSLIRLTDGSARPDIVFPRRRVAVFVDGCFWHGCPEHGHQPKANQAYWRPKLQRNARRDRATNQRLTTEGWRVVRLWEHEPLTQAVKRITDALASST